MCEVLGRNASSAGSPQFEEFWFGVWHRGRGSITDPISSTKPPAYAAPSEGKACWSQFTRPTTISGVAAKELKLRYHNLGI